MRSLYNGLFMHWYPCTCGPGVLSHVWSLHVDVLHVMSLCMCGPYHYARVVLSRVCSVALKGRPAVCKVSRRVRKHRKYIQGPVYVNTPRVKGPHGRNAVYTKAVFALGVYLY